MFVSPVSDRNAREERLRKGNRVGVRLERFTWQEVEGESEGEVDASAHRRFNLPAVEDGSFANVPVSILHRVVNEPLPIEHRCNRLSIQYAPFVGVGRRHRVGAQSGTTLTEGDRPRCHERS